MKLKDWVAITSCVDEYNIYNGDIYHAETKQRMLDQHGEDIIDEIIINSKEEGAWIVAYIFLY